MNINNTLFIGFLLQKQIDIVTKKNRTDEEVHAVVENDFGDFLAAKNPDEIASLENAYGSHDKAKTAWLKAKFEE